MDDESVGNIKPPIGVNKFRRGTITVNRDSLLGDAQAAAALMSRIVVVKCDHNACTDRLEFWCYCDDFDMVDVGCELPEYDAVFTRDGENLSVRFVRKSRGDVMSWDTFRAIREHKP